MALVSLLSVCRCVALHYLLTLTDAKLRQKPTAGSSGGRWRGIRECCTEWRLITIIEQCTHTRQDRCPAAAGQYEQPAGSGLPRGSVVAESGLSCCGCPQARGGCPASGAPRMDTNERM